MSAAALVAIGLALTTLMAWARIARWAMRTTAGAGPRWRLAILLCAQPLLAALVYLALFPPPGPEGRGATLVVATRDAPRLTAPTGDLRINLPEAPQGWGGEPAPDLATALRRHPSVTRLRILGDGLEPRDREATSGVTLVFMPPPPRAGLTELYPPAAAAPGAAFQVAGRVDGAGGGSVELLDPAGRVVDSEPLSAAGGFVLTGAARDPGPALFAVRARDRRRGVVDVGDVPVWIAADPGPRVLLLAGAPGPEVKQLRRWAEDAGVTLQTSVGAGDGLDLGEARPHLEAATLDKLDLVIVDERSWSALNAAERAALIAATRGGMGLLLRVTGPVPAAVRAQWSALGLPLGSGDESAAVRLDPDASSPHSSNAADAGDALPQLTRRVVDAPSPGAAPLAQDITAAALGRWRAMGRGRAGIWAVTDSSGLVTAGFGDRYGELWSALFKTLARASLTPDSTSETSSHEPPRAGQRVTVCWISKDAEVDGPDNRAIRLYVDPASGPTRCAGFWPDGPGWRLVRSVGPDGGARRDRPLYVYPADSLPHVRAQALRDNTVELASANPARTPARGQPGLPGPEWPWLVILLIVAASLWWFERTRIGGSVQVVTRQADGGPAPGR